MATLKDLWSEYIRKNPQAANNPVPFQTPLVKAPVVTNPVQVKAPVFPSNANVNKVKLPADYINPQTGSPYSPEEYANKVAQKIPVSKPTGDVPTYAGRSLTEGPQTAEQLQMKTAELNNARNDIAVGETDPYNINQSGIAYSPDELNAIRKAYAGVYDPAINSALAKLDAKQKEEAAKAEMELWKEKQKFSTEENIRQYKATTGLKKSDSDLFTQSQLNSGATNANMTMDEFSLLDSDLKNFFINNTAYKAALKQLENGEITKDELAQEIVDSNAPQSVKEYFIDKLPLTKEEKEGWFSKILGFVVSLAQ